MMGRRVTQALEETFTRLQEQTAPLDERPPRRRREAAAIHLEQPDLVVDAIRQVVEDIGAGARRGASPVVAAPMAGVGALPVPGWLV